MKIKLAKHILFLIGPLFGASLHAQQDCESYERKFEVFAYDFVDGCSPTVKSEAKRFLYTLAKAEKVTRYMCQDINKIQAAKAKGSTAAESAMKSCLNREHFATERLREADKLLANLKDCRASTGAADYVQEINQTRFADAVACGSGEKSAKEQVSMGNSLALDPPVIPGLYQTRADREKTAVIMWQTRPKNEMTKFVEESVPTPSH